VVTTVAGSTRGSADGVGRAAQFFQPTGIAVDGAGNIYVADSGNRTIRKITSLGQVTTVAGSAGLNGSADGTGSDARFEVPRGIAVDGAGNVYVTDSSANTIRKITSGGVVTTLAGKPGLNGATDGTGSAARFWEPYGVAVDGAGNVYVADRDNSTVRKITSGGVVTTLAGSAGNGGGVDGTGSAAGFNYPSGIAIGSDGNIFVADTYGSTIRKITSGGVVTTIGGLYGAVGSIDGIGSAARFVNPAGIAIGSIGRLYVAESGTDRNLIRVGVPPAGTGSGASTAINQTISFGALANQTTGAGPITLNATASSGLPVTFAVVSGPATLNGNSLTLTGAGTVVVRASQVGNATYNAATSVDQSFTVAALAVAPVPALTNYAPPSLSPNAVITFSGTTVDPKLGTSPDSSVIRVTSTTAFQGGTYTYTRTGATTAQLKYTAVTTSTGFTETETGTVNLILSSATRGTYTSSGSYSGTSSGTPFSGTFTGSGSFTYAPPAGAPVVATQPSSQVVAPGGSVTLSVGITSGGVTYQWQKDGAIISGQTGSSLTLTNLTAADSGAYTAVITNSAASILSDTVTLTVATSSTAGGVTSRLSNLSVLTTLAKDQVLTVGFTMQGGSKPVLVRAVGPSLAALGVPGSLPDPTLTLYTNSAKVNANDDWLGNAEVSAASARVGAFALSSASSNDSALVGSINGGYTTEVTGSALARNPASNFGTVIVEVYDAGTGTTPRLTNISARNQVGTGGNILIAGFTIDGTGTKNLLIRAVGPGLTQFGVGGVLADPKLELYAAGATASKIDQNDNWSSALSATFSSVGAFSLAAGSKDAALTVRLPPGGYTVQVSGADGGTGNAIVEIYELP
jgi:hypothetical protein